MSFHWFSLRTACYKMDQTAVRLILYEDIHHCLCGWELTTFFFFISHPSRNVRPLHPPTFTSLLSLSSLLPLLFLCNLQFIVWLANSFSHISTSWTGYIQRLLKRVGQQNTDRSSPMCFCKYSSIMKWGLPLILSDESVKYARPCVEGHQQGGKNGICVYYLFCSADELSDAYSNCMFASRGVQCLSSTQAVTPLSCLPAVSEGYKYRIVYKIKLIFCIDHLDFYLYSTFLSVFHVFAFLKG